jgi:hypothetical protein
MAEQETLHGLTCPNCGGVLQIPEGELIVCCPYCSLRSFVRGERGLLRFQVQQRVDQQTAAGALGSFFSSNWAIARDVRREARLSESFLVYLPFWTAWERTAAWVFGEKQVGSGDSRKMEPREVRLVQEMAWNSAACDTGEFGVEQTPLVHDPNSNMLEPFNTDALHAAGMVFEPVGSVLEARRQVEQEFQQQVRQKAKLTNISQVFMRSFHRRFGLVYYPVWVLRYLYHGRSFQIVVDGHSGKVLYGKAPGNTLYRAAILVGGMALGAVLAVDIASLIFAFGDEDSGMAGLGVFVLGLIVMGAAYRLFRYGEQYEYRFGGKKKKKASGRRLEGLPQLSNLSLEELEKWTDRLS